MRCDVESFDDFCQYYTGKYVKGRDSSSIYYIVGRVEDDIVHVQKYTNGRLDRSQNSLSWATVADSVMFGLPRLGTMVYNNELLYLYYEAIRSGGRGYDPRRIRWTSFNSWVLMRNDMRVFEEGILSKAHFVWLATRNGHEDWHTAQTDMLSETPDKPAYAVSYNFGVYLGEHSKPILTYKTHSIGTLEEVNLVNLKPNFNQLQYLIRSTLSNDIRFA